MKYKIVEKLPENRTIELPDEFDLDDCYGFEMIDGLKAVLLNEHYMSSQFKIISSKSFCARNSYGAAASFRNIFRNPAIKQAYRFDTAKELFAWLAE